MPADFIDRFVEAGIAVVSGSNTWSGHDRGTTIGASEIGACARRVFYEKHGQEQDPDFTQDWGAAERGHAIEDWYVDRLRRGLPEGVKLLYAGDEQKTLARGAQSATPDGIILDTREGQEDVIYLEIKSIDPRVYDVMTQAKQQHELQSIQGMDLVRDLLKFKVTRAIIVYINASFVSQRRYFEVPFDEKVAAALRNRAEDMLFGKHSETNLPRAEGKMEGGKECGYCPFYRSCTAHDVGKLPTEVRPLQDIPADVVERAKDLVVQQRALAQQLGQIEGAKKATEAEIVELLVKSDTKSIKAPWGSITTYGQSGPPQFDIEKMEADGIDLDKYRKPGTRGTRLTVSWKG